MLQQLSGRLGDGRIDKEFQGVVFPFILTAFQTKKLCPPVQEVLSSLKEVISNKHGKKVLLYLLSHRNPAHLLPEIIKVLEQGDGNAHR